MNKLHYVEFHVTDKCNLNCNGCSHFSPMVKANRCNYDSFKSDIERLSELFTTIDNIRLLGGEPFLEPQLDKYVFEIRDKFPKSNIEIATNGLLIPKCKHNVLKTIKECNALLNITLYPPTFKKRWEIKKILDKYNIEYIVSPIVKKFRKRFCPKGNSDVDISYKNCNVGKRCTIVYNGKIALCSVPFVVDFYNEYYGEKLIIENCTLDIHSQGITSAQIIDFLSRGNDSCRFCGVCLEEDWSQCEDLKNIDINHWLSEKNYE